ncbi:MAG TPA: metalloregulator ArsR/SmtB family transcription factor, partial [Patescibacteria group bacterium]|nr:metalloregulator ArsR/SmtB family transcription factor [Patescibacteria group bacterium]
MEYVLTALRAVAEPTRLRLLALCAQGELTVSELVNVLGQSQPRVSRHLKLMCDGGLLERFREGAWVFYRLAPRGPGAELARRTLDLIPADDPVLARDNARLVVLKQGRATAAAAYFRDNAARWAELRSLH